VKIPGVGPKGRAATIAPGDVELTRETKEGWGVASDGPLTVALDLDLDPWPALQREGMVREVIHHVQNLRKAAGLSVTDRIELEIRADPSDRLGYAVGTHTSLVAAEVLADSVEVGSLDTIDDGWERSVHVQVDGMPARLSLRRI